MSKLQQPGGISIEQSTHSALERALGYHQNQLNYSGLDFVKDEFGPQQ